MATKVIDPAFQAAPYLGDVEAQRAISYAQRRNLMRFKQEVNKEPQEKDIDSYIKELLSKVKDFDDKRGFEEITNDLKTVHDTCIKYSKQRLNKGQEANLYKAIEDSLSEIQHKVNVRNEQKVVYDFVQKQILDPKNEGLWDKEATADNLTSVLNSNDILDRSDKLKNVIVKVPQEEDVLKYVSEHKDFIPKPDIITRPYTDATGQTMIREEQIITPKIEKEIINSMGTIYDFAPQKIKDTIRTLKEKEPNEDLRLLPDKDYFVTKCPYPQIQQKIIDRVSGSKGFAINIWGAKGKISEGKFVDNPIPFGLRTYKDRYEFASSPKFLVPIGLEGSTYHIGAGDPEKGDDGWAKVPKTGGLIEAELNFYDPVRDEFVFRTTSSGMLPFVYNNMTYAIPRSIVGKAADELPIIDKDGKLKKLKDIYSSTPETLKLIGGRDDRTGNIPKSKR